MSEALRTVFCGTIPAPSHPIPYQHGTENIGKTIRFHLETPRISLGALCSHILPLQDILRLRP